jgi:hypothetical protein
MVLIGCALRDECRLIVAAVEHKVSIATAEQFMQPARIVGADGREYYWFWRPCWPVVSKAVAMMLPGEREEPAGEPIGAGASEYESC